MKIHPQIWQIWQIKKKRVGGTGNIPNLLMTTPTTFKISLKNLRHLRIDPSSSGSELVMSYS